MTATHTGIEDAELDGGVFGRLIFQWHGDRYTHSWLCCETSEKLLESVESDHALHWPLCPPLQQVYRQSFEDGREVMFGIGMSGRGHWSASFTLVPDLKSWIVELACCSPTTPLELLSTYRLLGHWQPDTAANGSSRLVCVSGASQLWLEPLSSQTRFGFDTEQLGSRNRAIIPELRISPTAIAEGAATTQWGFRLRIAEN
jgi:hypothetical protein